MVEGNRRLAALKLLADEELRSKLDLDDSDEWDELAGSVQIPDTVPVILVDDRRSVAPIVGYRHISGIEPWDPWAKARFIAGLIEDDNLGFDQVSDEVGESRNTIKSNYRDYRIIQSARQHNINTDRAERRFGVFARAMNSPSLRNHIGTISPSEVETGIEVVPENKSDEIKELITWLFGLNDLDPVIQESRDITRLGTAVGSDDGLSVLRETRDLEEAFIAAGGLRDRLISRLQNASRNLERAEDDLPVYSNDDEVLSLIEQCRNTLLRLQSLTADEVKVENGNSDD